MVDTTHERLWKLYTDGIAFQRAMGFQAKWAELVRFYNSIQWPAPTPETKALPRPVFNVIEFDIRHNVM